VEVHDPKDSRKAQARQGQDVRQRQNPCAHQEAQELHGQNGEVMAMKHKAEHRELQRQLPYIHTQRLKAFAHGKYEGRPVPSYYTTMAKQELRRRGVSLKPRHKARRDPLGLGSYW